MPLETQGHSPDQQDDEPDALESAGLLGSPKPATANRAIFTRRHPSNLITVLVALVVGTFVASCPLPRKALPQWLRLVLIVFAASLVTAPPLRNSRLLSLQFPWRRLGAAYAGLAIAAFSLFALADEVHLELRWMSVLGYQSPSGLRLGYFSRCALAALGFALQKATRLCSTRRILASYLLCTVWLYIDAPLTLLSLASGREHW